MYIKCLRTYLASVLSFGVGAQRTIGQTTIIHLFFALVVVDNRQVGVPENVRILAVRLQVSPSHGGDRLVVTVETRRHQANGRHVVRVVHGRVQRQNGQVVSLLKTYYYRPTYI
jgi:hypothetical protein